MLLDLTTRLSDTDMLDGRMCRMMWGLPSSTSPSKERWAEETSWRSRTSFWPAGSRLTEFAHSYHISPLCRCLSMFLSYLTGHVVFLCLVNSYWSRPWWSRSSCAGQLIWTWQRIQPTRLWPSTLASARWSVSLNLTSTSAKSPCLETSLPMQFCIKVKRMED